MNAHTATWTAAIALTVFVIFLLVMVLGNFSRHHASKWRYTAELDKVGKLMAAGQYDEVEVMLRPLVRKKDAPGDFAFLRAVAAERRGDDAFAMRLWKRQTKKDPAIAHGYTGQARLLIKHGKVEQAHRLLEAARSRVLVPADLTISMAETAQARKDWENAIRLWKQLRTEAPGRAEGYLQARICLLAVGRTEEAEELLQDVAMRIPADPRVRHAVRKASRPPQPPGKTDTPPDTGKQA